MTSEPLSQDTEIIKKSFYITFNYLIKNFAFYPIEHSQVSVKHNLPSSNYFYLRLYVANNLMIITVCDNCIRLVAVCDSLYVSELVSESFQFRARKMLVTSCLASCYEYS